MDNITRFIKTSIVYFLGNILSKLVSILLLPIYTSRLLPEQYGEYDLVITLVNLFTPIAFFQIWDAMYRFAFDYKKNSDKYYIINNSIIVSAIGILIYVAISYIGYLYFDYAYPGYVLVFGLVSGLNYIASFACRLFLKNVLFVASGLVNTLISALSCIILILVFEWDVKALYLSVILGSIIQIIIIDCKLGLIKNFRRDDYNWNLCKKMFSFSIPLCIATISYWLLSGYTKLAITNNLGLEDNGYYAVANRFASMITVFVSIFQYAWNEVSYLMSVDDNRKASYSLSISLLFKTVLFGSSLVCIFVKLIFPYFIGPNFYGALDIIPITIYGVAFNCIAGFIGTLFMTEKRTQHILYSTILASFVNIISCSIFTGLFGLYGATLSLSLAFLFLFLLRVFQMRQFLKVKIDVRFFLFLILFIVTSFVFHSVNNILLEILYIIVIIVMYFISIKDFIKTLKNKYAGIINKKD